MFNNTLIKTSLVIVGSLIFQFASYAAYSHKMYSRVDRDKMLKMRDKYLQKPEATVDLWAIQEAQMADPKFDWREAAQQHSDMYFPLTFGSSDSENTQYLVQDHGRKFIKMPGLIQKASEVLMRKKRDIAGKIFGKNNLVTQSYWSFGDWEQYRNEMADRLKKNPDDVEARNFAKSADNDVFRHVRQAHPDYAGKGRSVYPEAAMMGSEQLANAIANDAWLRKNAPDIISERQHKGYDSPLYARALKTMYQEALTNDLILAKQGEKAILTPQQNFDAKKFLRHHDDFQYHNEWDYQQNRKDIEWDYKPKTDKSFVSQFYDWWMGQK